MKDDMDVETLLDLDGSIFDQGEGYWLKIEVGESSRMQLFRTASGIR